MTDSEKLDLLLKKVDGMDQRLCIVEKRLDGMDQRIKSVELTLENETNRNIRLIAEGHRDVSRKLDDALQVEHEKEMLLIRMNIVENDVDIIKRKLDIA
ncbi:MAG: hypothetical protein LUE19_08675 [Clostridiales bacterium]|nr:hypothetical protein [Clostridiales bacterium]